VGGKKKELLVQIADAAVQNDVHVTFKNCEQRHISILLEIAEAGQDNITFDGRLSKTLFERSVFIADIRSMPSTQEPIMCTQSSQLPLCLSRFWRHSNRTQHARSEQLDWIRTSNLGHDMAVLSICGKNGT
jgi:hypothetical protein